MNKGDLINEVAKVVSTKKEAQEAVDCVFSSITKALKKGDTVSLVGFGSFKVAKRKARKGRNPQTGEEIKIKASKTAKFTPGKSLKEAVK
jgi:DNA-binding protein HU-beta